jgi:lipopolysaccharide export system permease protein
VQYKISDRYLHELLFPGPDMRQDNKERRKMLAEATYRLATPLYIFLFVSLALWAIIGGPFNRTGYGGRIAYAAAYATVLRIVGFGVQSASEGAAVLNVLQFAVPVIPTVIAVRRLLWPRLLQDIREATADLIPLATGARA